jgi:ribosome modulation factor
MIEPRNFAMWNRAHRGAYRKGYSAGASGEPIESCPYEDRRKESGRLSWSRSFITAWTDGWEEGRKQFIITEYHANRSGRSQPPPQPR